MLALKTVLADDIALVQITTAAIGDQSELWAAEVPAGTERGCRTELVAEVSYYQSEYGVPTATAYYKQQYWRFKDWQRLMTNLGGSFPVLDGGYVKARLYYVKHYNILDAYKNDQFNARQWESTYDNYALGAFVLGMVPLGRKHQLHASISYRDDDVSTQSAVGAAWEHYEHKTLSLGVEDPRDIIRDLEEALAKV